MKAPPPEIIASWPEPDYMDPDYQGPQLLIVGVILLVVSCTVVGLRLWVRLHMKNSASWDDWIILSVIPFMVCSTAAAILGTRYGWGYHIWDSKPGWRKPALMTSYFSQICLTIIMTLVKLSLLASYLRFLTLPLYRHLNWGMITLVTCWGIAFLVASLTACRPLRAYWDTELALQAQCIDDQARTLAFTISNLVTDVMILILPIPTFWRLKLPIRERLALTGLMSLGLLACAASAVRLYYAHRIYHVTYDSSWEGYNLSLWILVETNLAVICASIPTLRPLVRGYFSESRLNSRSYGNGSSSTHRHVAQGVSLSASTHPPPSPGSPRIYKQTTIKQTFYMTESTEALNDEAYQVEMSSRGKI
ncbi:hypothetical protein BJX68DRAFT_271014 [Aspergillus pseudodeflectus]|uniref:Rhodopsin domain-containing protein n=1 Tax=Aspergillus pseudodeflectus TaxID=176178 RepID=A0ABR4JP77_9EURO